jgi:hypothetical protein
MTGTKQNGNVIIHMGCNYTYLAIGYTLDTKKRTSICEKFKINHIYLRLGLSCMVRATKSTEKELKKSFGIKFAR